MANASGVLCDRQLHIKLKEKFYRITERPAMLYCLSKAVTEQYIQKINIIEIRMLR